MRKRILIVGGGTAGWLTAGYLAKRLACDLPNGVSIQLVESPEIGILGVGEGTFPTIRRTLATIGMGEAELIRRCGATFKHGNKFVHWRKSPESAGRDHYFHGFQAAHESTGLELLPYWLLGAAEGLDWDEAATPQKVAADAGRAPKLATHPDYQGPLNYAFHFDAVTLAGLLRDQGIANGVSHLIDTVTEVLTVEEGIAGVRTNASGVLEADLYIDCTGFSARLIGGALGSCYRSCHNVLFCDRAVAMQVPYRSADDPIRSYTTSTAQEAGWIWDIGLEQRRGIGHVYSSAHMSDDRAEALVRAYAGQSGDGLEVRRFTFDPGYREVSWAKNCVAIGLSSGFFEPIEATGIVFAEIAAALVANLFPWGGDFETSARQFNNIMRRRYERTLDFIKLHYCLSERSDNAFWTENRASETIPDSLSELLDRWRFRPPNELDVDGNIDIFSEASWQYVLYGMGWKTDLSARASSYRYFDEAKAAFAKVRSQSDYAVRTLPSNRDLIRQAHLRSFGPTGVAA
jgi:glycine/D-amino acid oxidase-like deaminating enzyme